MDKKGRQVICVFTAEGKRHDFKVYKDSRVHINAETEVKVDTGYTGIKEIHSNSVLPKKRKRRKKGQKEMEHLTKEERRFNRKVSSERVTNEHVIGYVKRFNILSYPYRNRRKRFGLRMNLICGICNVDANMQ